MRGYNQQQYNVLQYNATGIDFVLSESVVLLEANVVLAGTITPITRGYNKRQYNVIQYNATGIDLVLVDLNNLTENSFNFDFEDTLFDFIFMSEGTQIQMTAKALLERIRLNDWLQIEKKPTPEYWHD